MPTKQFLFLLIISIQNFAEASNSTTPGTVTAATCTCLVPQNADKTCPKKTAGEALKKTKPGRFNLFLDPNTTAIEHVLTFHLLYRHLLYCQLLRHLLCHRFLYLHLLYRQTRYSMGRYKRETSKSNKRRLLPIYRSERAKKNTL